MPGAASLERVVDPLDPMAVPGAAQPATDPPLLELRGITKRWSGVDHPVLDDCGLVLEPGTVTWIGGRNGAGKTTLLRIAAGLIGADAGRISLQGLDPVRDRRAFQMRSGMLSAGNGGLYARLKVEWHLNWWGRLALLPRERRRELVREALVTFDLADLTSRRVDRLSMGQRQRLRLAGAFLHQPEVILLDEPRNSFDSEGHELLAGAIADAAGRGAAVLWCTPSGEEDEKILTHRRFILEFGRLVAQ